MLPAEACHQTPSSYRKWIPGAWLVPSRALSELTAEAYFL